MEIQLWREILNPYDLAVKELTVKFEHLIQEHRQQGLYSPIEQVEGRVKSISSILDKCQKKKIDLEDIASALGLNFDELIKEMEAIVFSGTKLNIDYYINKILDEEQQQEIMDYFMEASSDNISEAFDEFEGDYAEEDLRLMRLKLHSKHGN